MSSKRDADTINKCFTEITHRKILILNTLLYIILTKHNFFTDHLIIMYKIKL